MFNFKKQRNTFIFYESNTQIVAYKNTSQEVEEISCFEFSNLEKELDKIKKEQPSISNSQIYFILNSRLESIEKPNLPKEELLNYAKWKIQEIVDVPMHDVYFDLISNNHSEVPFFKKYCTVVIDKKQKIDFIINCFNKNKLNLTSIDHQSTAALNSLVKNKNLLKQKSLAVLDIQKNNSTLQIYYEDGVIFERTVALSLNLNENNDLPEEQFFSLFDKICLEAQRNIDFVDRQYSIPHFENILFVTPFSQSFIRLQEELANNFNVSIINSSSFLEYKPKVGTQIPFYVLASFEKNKNNLEKINLKPTLKKSSSFQEDLKKIFAISLVFGVGIAATGAFYDVKYKKIISSNKSLAKENELAVKNLNEEKKKETKTNQELEKSISTLIRHKAEIFELNSNIDSNNPIYYKNILADIAIHAKNSSVILEDITINKKGIYLYGKTTNKHTFITFLNNLKSIQYLSGKDVSNIFLEQREDILYFKISSPGLGEIK